MEPAAIGVTVIVGLVLTLLNGIISWKLWSRCTHLDVSDYRKTFISSLFIDPLVAAIACPMVSDFIFSFQWSATCGTFFVLVMTGVSLLLYAFSLLFLYRLVAMMSPSQHCCQSTSIWKNTAGISFILSVGVNVFLTWITLQFVLGSTIQYNYYEPENCWSSMLKRNLVILFVFCLTVQVVYVLLYAFLSCRVIRKSKNGLGHNDCQLLTPQDTIGNPPLSEDITKTISIYTALTLCCLIMTGVLKLSYNICSCFGFEALVSSLYYINLLIVAKLPSFGLLYLAAFSVISMFKSV